MCRQLVYIAYFLLILGFISEARSQSQPCVDSQSLIAGLQRAESPIVSGKGEVHFQMVRNKRSESAIFAFNEKKVYMDYQLESLRNRCIYNGYVELGIGQDPDNPDKIGDMILVDRKTIIAQEDPRNLGIQFDELPLSQYFQKHGFHILGSEVLQKEPCYVVESVHRNGKPIKFWIAINSGFRSAV